MEKKYQPLFENNNIGNVKLKNRFAMAPMGPLGLGDVEGGFNQRGIDYYVERARGGTGLIFTGVTFVDNEIEAHDMPNVPCSTHNGVHFIRTSRELTEKVHAYGSKIFLQLSGGFGRVTIPTNLGEHPPVAPSPIKHRWLDKTCRELTVAEIKEIVRQFGQGAYNAKRGGFDGVQIHAVHEGYLLDQFAISMFNQRTDEYGGCLENRLRFAREVVEEIKRRCGDDFPVTLRYSVKSFIKDWRVGALPGEEFEEMGKDTEEGLEAAKLLEKYGYDAFDVDVGTYDSWWWNHPPMYQKKGLYIPYCEMMKEVVSVPVICAGRMDNPDLAISALEEGACDIISLGRPLLADAHLVNKLKKDGYKSVRPCLSCHEGCMGRIQEYSALNCAVNPEACRERSERLIPAYEKKKVMIVGGGVAGAEAARVLKLRGHEPILFEKTDKLGGNLIPGGTPDFKEDDHLLADWYEYELDRLGVEVKKNTIVTEADLKNSDADEIILATGSKPKVFSIGSGPVYTAAEVLLGEKEVGEDVSVIGGGLVGCELALWLKQKGKNVNIIERMEEILQINGPLCHANSEMLEALIPHNNIATYTASTAKDFDGQNLVLQTEDGEQVIKTDSVVLAVGYESENTLYEKLKYDLHNVHILGDASRVSNIMYAIWDAYEFASNL